MGEGGTIDTIFFWLPLPTSHDYQLRTANDDVSALLAVSAEIGKLWEKDMIPWFDGVLPCQLHKEAQKSSYLRVGRVSGVDSRGKLCLDALPTLPYSTPNLQNKATRSDARGPKIS